MPCMLNAIYRQLGVKILRYNWIVISLALVKSKIVRVISVKPAGTKYPRAPTDNELKRRRNLFFITSF